MALISNSFVTPSHILGGAAGTLVSVPLVLWCRYRWCLVSVPSQLHPRGGIRVIFFSFFFSSKIRINKTHCAQRMESGRPIWPCQRMWRRREFEEIQRDTRQRVRSIVSDEPGPTKHADDACYAYIIPCKNHVHGVLESRFESRCPCEAYPMVRRVI
jgi:hypothetical protein